MRVMHLMASPFVGGPEQQALGLARHLPPPWEAVFCSFAEGGRARALLDQARADGFETIELEANAPHFRAAIREIADHLQRRRADVLCCHGYKPDVIGWRAARRVGIPVVAVAHGWTAATLKVRLNERLDRFVMQFMDCIVAVSDAQAGRVRQAGVPDERISVIRNAVDASAFAAPDPAARQELLRFFARPPRWIVGAAGRLSPEKGFDQFIEAAARVASAEPEIGFVIFGDGPLRNVLARQVSARGLAGRLILAGFRADLCRFVPHWDLAVLSSYTEGLPVVVLEALAAGVPVVATAVGGTPEIVEDGINGYLVPPGDADLLAQRMLDVLRSGNGPAMGQRGRQRVEAEFSFTAQADQYARLFARLTGATGRSPLEVARVAADRVLPSGG